ncbi:MAG: type I methionyl aminopeptidase [Planctomycetota bacterium]
MVGRNDPCPCGSGKKFKKCHGDQSEHGSAPVVPQSGITIKTPTQIEAMRRACRLAAEILKAVGEQVKPGVSTGDLDRFVHEMTLEHGAYPSPLNYPHPPTDPRHPKITPGGFPRSTCTSVNSVVCHGIPDDQAILHAGDIVNVDVTATLAGYFGDCSATFYVGEPAPHARRLTEVTLECLHRGIAAVRPGVTFEVIGDAIQSHAEAQGFGVVRDFVGHGIGTRFHEAPQIFHYRTTAARAMIKEGMIFTIEPMINEGTYEVTVGRDGWTVYTKDGKLSAQFEHTVLVTRSGVEILTLVP